MMNDALDRRQLLQRTGAFALTLGAASMTGLEAVRADSHAESTVDRVNRLIQDLAPRNAPPSGLPIGGPNTRRVVIRNPDGREQVFWVDYDSSASVTVHFRTDSAKISKRSDTILEILSRALKSRELRAYRYMMAGHTDARASDAYNLALSQRRAVSVTQHLANVHAVDANRLIPVGFGEKELRNPSKPNSGINRRVEVGLIVRPPDGAGEVAVDDGNATNALIGQ
ncbi:MAG: OmpA family protein [Pseudomonadota bacterium]